MKNTKKRLVYLDILRIMAAFLVIFNHLPGYKLYSVSGGLKQVFYLFLTMITRMNTPLFMMISGALLIDKEENYVTLFKKRILRFLIVIVVANSIIWFLYFPIDLKKLFLGIVGGKIQGSYWYLYSYLGMLFCLPFIRKMAKNLATNDFWFMLIVHFIYVSIIPCINFFLEFNGDVIQLSSNFNVLLMIESSIFYPLMGYWLSIVDLEKVNRKIIIGTIVVTLMGITIESAFTVYEGHTSEYTQHYVMLFDYLVAICCFIIVRKIFSYISVSRNAENVLALLGSVTFGVYLFDPMIKKYLYSVIEDILEPILPTLLVSLIWCLISFAICGSITYLLRKNKVIRSIL